MPIFPHDCFLLSSSFSHTDLLPSRPASSSSYSSAASLAPSSGGFKQRRISYRPKRPASPPRGCREEFSSSRCGVVHNYCVNLLSSCYICLEWCYLNPLLWGLIDSVNSLFSRICWMSGSYSDQGFRSCTSQALSWSHSSSISLPHRQKLVRQWSTASHINSSGLPWLKNIAIRFNQFHRKLTAPKPLYISVLNCTGNVVIIFSQAQNNRAN